MGVIRPQNLNDIFQAAANQAKQKLPELTHNQKVRAKCPGGTESESLPFCCSNGSVCNHYYFTGSSLVS